MSNCKDCEKSKGLGDTIAKITKRTGIDSLVKKIVGKDCGCEERRQFLNNIFEYHKEEYSKTKK